MRCFLRHAFVVPPYLPDVFPASCSLNSFPPADVRSRSCQLSANSACWRPCSLTRSIFLRLPTPSRGSRQRGGSGGRGITRGGGVHCHAVTIHQILSPP
eukprot:180809-Prorocentrum_minimum.AAC.1